MLTASEGSGRASCWGSSQVLPLKKLGVVQALPTHLSLPRPARGERGAGSPRNAHLRAGSLAIMVWDGLEGTLMIIMFQLPDMGTFHQTRFIRATSSLVLDTSRDGAAIAFLGNLRQFASEAFQINGHNTSHSCRDQNPLSDCCVRPLYIWQQGSRPSALRRWPRSTHLQLLIKNRAACPAFPLASTGHFRVLN